jgi:hypothetical protein
MPARSRTSWACFAVNFFRAQIDQHQMIVGAAADDAITVLGQTGGQRFRVDHNLALIIAELRLERFVETNRFGGNDVHERSALNAGKTVASICFANFSWHMTMPPRGPRRLLCVVVVTNARAGSDWMLAAGDEPGDVRHVDEKKRADESAICARRGKSMMRG